MATKAYVLVKAAVGKLGDVAEALRDLPGVMSVDPVSGPYDIIVRVEGIDLSTVGKLISAGIRPMSGISRTVTCLIV